MPEPGRPGGASYSPPAGQADTLRQRGGSHKSEAPVG